MRYSTFPTAWGYFGFVARGKSLISTYLPQEAEDLGRAIRDGWPEAVEDREALPRFRRNVVDYFEGKSAKFAVDMDLSEVPTFQRMVLEACGLIPYGKTASYADLARAVGKPGAARAVGGAMAHNPLPLVIPCHRVVRSDGSLGGFSSPRGINEKVRLLRLESALPVEYADANLRIAKRGPKGRRAVVPQRLSAARYA